VVGTQPVPEFPISMLVMAIAVGLMVLLAQKANFGKLIHTRQLSY